MIDVQAIIVSKLRDVEPDLHKDATSEARGCGWDGGSISDAKLAAKLRLIVKYNLTSAQELADLRAKWQEERQAAALVRLNLQRLRDEDRARVNQEQG